MVYLMNDEYENLVCTCDKPYKDWETCPECGEKICIDCEDWEETHRRLALRGEEDITNPS